ncbi:MAG TPA: hypothetical protein VKX17_08755 [Planctomycetota bacterium]|nr:hypothetical protein [Planctomycetota bacterium]
MFPFFGISILSVLQLVCIVHVLIRRKDIWWIALLLFMPGISAIVYTWTEIIPSLRHSNLSQIQLPIFQKLKIKEYEHALEECDSVDNRVNLAEMYAKFNRHEEALTLIKDCMSGPCKDSPDLIFTYAIIQFENGNAAEALAQLDKLDKLDAKNRRKERRLLRARVLDKLDKFDEAETKYSEALKGFDGEEARYRYADFLMRRDRYAEALALAQQGIAYYKKSERLYKRIEAYWYSALKMLVRECRKKIAAK